MFDHSKDVLICPTPAVVLLLTLYNYCMVLGFAVCRKLWITSLRSFFTRDLSFWI